MFKHIFGRQQCKVQYRYVQVNMGFVTHSQKASRTTSPWRLSETTACLLPYTHAHTLTHTYTHRYTHIYTQYTDPQSAIKSGMFEYTSSDGEGESHWLTGKRALQ